MRFLVVLALCLLAALPARAEEILAGLSQKQLSLTVNFEGSEILVFGAVRREAPLPEEGELHVIVTIEGPPTPAVIWRKARRLGIWVNVESMRIRAAPSFYAVASTGPLEQILSLDSDLRHRISTRLAIFEAREDATVANPAAFSDALVRIRQNENLYQQLESSVTLERDTLFSTTISLPKNLVEGSYATRVFLVRDGAVIDRFDTEIDVQKAVLERWLYNMAYEQPFLYGLLALGLALFFGWGASAAFRVLRT
ncbi:TIGR02186 family protein [Rhodobacteraceae bacterium 2376]|uniref:TIGR02186 family protein n=1 Tax=Rhabdonatronobacter sediminivivens TaxID=2743469 RepID=A0A7Z0HZQ7_9RHOB|nr:TIGR02186 family protein [Rhabdonatronobacter sediminivivens]NYS24992.1 TIGR02186 family protein [Rhabdonatronobacter sediminivivens]